MKKMQLHDFHEKNGAVFTEVNNWTIPRNYNDPPSEIAALTNTIGLLDRSYLGKVKLTGVEAIDILNRISTNDMSKLIVGTVCDTVFSTPKGRIVDYCRVIHLQDGLLLISSYMGTKHLIEWLNRFIILEDVVTKDVSAHYLWLTLIGPSSQSLVASVAKDFAAGKDEVLWAERDNITFPLFLNNNFNTTAYNVCLTKTEAKKIIPWLSEKVREFHGTLIGDDAFQVMRVESGMPDWGTELTQDYNPHEARLLNAVSFTKGCYTGQEVIARLDTYDKVQKYLMIIDLEKPVKKEPPLDLFIDDDKVGVLTSYAFNPLTQKQVGLGYVKKIYAVENYNIQVEVETIEGRVKAGLRIPPTV